MQTDVQRSSQASWLPELPAGAGPKYLSISAALGADIAQGRLRAGDRLPPQRELAEALDVDLGTVTRAYAEARRLGLIDADGRRGSFVRVQPARGVRADVAPFDTGMNLPPLPEHSSLPERYTADLRAVLAGGGAANRLQYQPAGGCPEDRQAGAAWLAARGIAASEDNVLVTSGAQCALQALAVTALRPGDAVCTGAFVYPGWLAIARRMGLRIVPVAGDGEGVDPTALEEACVRERPAAVYLVPTNDNPSTATLPAARRNEIVAIARRHDLKIVEDDAYGLLSATPQVPLAALAPERTWHVASLSKIISPALRVAYLRAPSVRDAWALSAALHETTIMAPPLNMAVATRWLVEGTWQDLVAEVRAECVARQTIVAAALPSGSVRMAAEGYHFWLPLPDRTAPAELLAALAPSGLSVVSSDAFAAVPDDPSRALRVSIGGSLTRERLSRALTLLDASLHVAADRGRPMV